MQTFDSRFDSTKILAAELAADVQIQGDKRSAVQNSAYPADNDEFHFFFIEPRKQRFVILRHYVLPLPSLQGSNPMPAGVAQAAALASIATHPQRETCQNHIPLPRATQGRHQVDKRICRSSAPVSLRQSLGVTLSNVCELAITLPSACGCKPGCLRCRK